MMKSLSTICFLLFAKALFAQPSDTLAWSVVMGGNVKGYSKTWQLPDGSWVNHYQFNDRGRGDSTVTIYRENEKGVLTAVKISGVDYLKNPFTETFSMENGMARWKNPAEDEERKINGPAFYLGLKGGAGNLVKAIFNNGGTLDLLPAGKAKATVVFKGSYATPSGNRQLSLVSTEGLGFTPTYNWVDESLLDFATVSDWVSTIRKGAENLVPQLLEKQKEFEAELYSSIAKQQVQQVPNGICFRQVNVFDASTGKIIPNANVYVEDEFITRISFEKNPPLKEAMRVIDGSGKTLLPGLWDMHTHPSTDLDGILHIAAGVTNIRDMGSGPEVMMRKGQMETGKIIGPEISVLSGFIDGAGPFAAPTGTLINSVEEGRKHIKDYAEMGYQQIKLYSSIRPEWVKPMIEEAKKYNLKVCGHIPAFMTASQAIDAGYDEVTHINMLVLNFFGDTVDTRSPNRFRLPAAKTASLDLNSPAMKAFIRQMQEKHTVVDPTVNVFEEMFTARDGQMLASWKDIVHRFPIQAQRNIKAGGGGLPVPEGLDDTYKQSFEAMLRIVKLLYDNKVPLVAGTDAFPGFMLHRELELYARAGIPNAAVLQLATLGAAKVAGLQKQYGTIEKGKRANLVLVDGNPVKSISDIRRTLWVVKDGKLFNSKELYNTIGIQGYQ